MSYYLRRNVRFEVSPKFLSEIGLETVFWIGMDRVAVPEYMFRPRRPKRLWKRSVPLLYDP